MSAATFWSGFSGVPGTAACALPIWLRAVFSASESGGSSRSDSSASLNFAPLYFFASSRSCFFTASEKPRSSAITSASPNFLPRTRSAAARLDSARAIAAWTTASVTMSPALGASPE